MAAEKMKEIIQAITTDPKAQELLNSVAQPEDIDSEVCVYADIAKQLGYDITEEDLKVYLERLADSLIVRTEEAAAGIQELPNETLEQVAGGKKEHDDCKDTYRDYENCWLNDGCDLVYNDYNNYVCHNVSWVDPCHEKARPCSGDAYCSVYGF